MFDCNEPANRAAAARRRATFGLAMLLYSTMLSARVMQRYPGKSVEARQRVVVAMLASTVAAY